MEHTEQPENPFQSPRAVSVRTGIVARSFQVGVDERHTVIVESSIWTGLRTYAVNALGDAGPVHRGPCRFEIGDRERHQVQIEVDPMARVNAYVNGALVEANLLPSVRRVSLLILCFLLLLALILFLFGFLGYEKLVEDWIGALFIHSTTDRIC